MSNKSNPRLKLSRALRKTASALGEGNRRLARRLTRHADSLNGGEPTAADFPQWFQRGDVKSAIERFSYNMDGLLRRTDMRPAALSNPNAFLGPIADIIKQHLKSDR